MERRRKLRTSATLRSMAGTYDRRNRNYSDNFRMVGALLKVMFPKGVQLRTAEDFEVWHLFELKIVKLTRFVISGMSHVDSIHDDAIYSAMIEALLKEKPDWRICVR